MIDERKIQGSLLKKVFEGFFGLTVPSLEILQNLTSKEILIYYFLYELKTLKHPSYDK